MTAAVPFRPEAMTFFPPIGDRATRKPHTRRDHSSVRRARASLSALSALCRNLLTDTKSDDNWLVHWQNAKSGHCMVCCPERAGKGRGPVWGLSLAVNAGKLRYVRARHAFGVRSG